MGTVRRAPRVGVTFLPSAAGPILGRAPVGYVGPVGCLAVGQAQRSLLVARRLHHRHDARLDRRRKPWPSGQTVWQKIETVDAAEPSFWRATLGEDGERYAYPLSWDRPGFFEDYHDRVEEVRQQFWADHRRLYGEPRPPTKPPDAWRMIR